MLVDIARLAERFNMLLKAEPGKLDIKRREPFYSFYQFTHCFTLQTSDYEVISNFCVDSAS